QASYDHGATQRVPLPSTNKATTEVLPSPRSEVGANRGPLSTYIIIALLALIAGGGIVALTRSGAREASSAELTSPNVSNTSSTSPGSSATTKSATEAERTAPSPPSPKILSRQEWKAKDAVGTMLPNQPRCITIHHTASPQQEGITIEKKMRQLQR